MCKLVTLRSAVSVFILDSASEPKKYGLVTHLTWIQVSLRILTQRVSQKHTAMVLNEVSSKLSTLARWLTTFLPSLQAAFRISDNAIQRLFSFLKMFQTVLGRYSTECAAIAISLPRSIFKDDCGGRGVLWRTLCRKCNHLYQQNSTLESWQFKRFPRHPQARMRGECGGHLFNS